MLGLWVGVVWVLGLRPIVIARGVLKLWPFLLLTGLFHAFLTGHGSDEFVGFLRIDISMGSAVSATFFVGRLALILSVTVGLFQVYAPQDYGRAVGQMMGRVRVGRTTLAQTELVVTLALRFIPFIENEYRRIRFALIARGLGHGASMMGRMQVLRTSLFALLLNAFRRAEHITLALEARGYDPRIVRTSLREHPLHPADVVITAVFAGICAVAPWI